MASLAAAFPQVIMQIYMLKITQLRARRTRAPRPSPATDPQRQCVATGERRHLLWCESMSHRATFVLGTLWVPNWPSTAATCDAAG
jgi:hypothetical protein